jgi:hypothetical protein
MTGRNSRTQNLTAALGDRPVKRLNARNWLIVARSNRIVVLRMRPHYNALHALQEEN